MDYKGNRIGVGGVGGLSKWRLSLPDRERTSAAQREWRWAAEAELPFAAALADGNDLPH